METRPGTLLMVMELLGPARRPWYGRDTFELDVYPLSDWLVLDLPDEDEPGNFRAISAVETRFIGDPDIREVHYSGGGWNYWICWEPWRYPKPPFLVTDNPAHRLVYHGVAALLPTEIMVKAFERDLRDSGKRDHPISGEGWFGLVRMRAPRTDRGECWIYSDADVDVSGRHDDVHWEDLPFGSVIFPSR